LLGVVNDREGAVEVVIDQEVWAAEALQSHPLVNTSTLAIGRADVERLLQATGHEPRIVDVPARVG
jgi:Ala-tRNA(Pro) deacylase